MEGHSTAWPCHINIKFMAQDRTVKSESRHSQVRVTSQSRHSQVRVRVTSESRLSQSQVRVKSVSSQSQARVKPESSQSHVSVKSESESSQSKEALPPPFLRINFYNLCYVLFYLNLLLFATIFSRKFNCRLLYVLDNLCNSF